MNVDKLFSLFTLGDSEVYKENKVEDILDNSFVLVGMAVKGVENYYIIDQIYTAKYGDLYLSSRENIRLKYFTGLYRYLERVDLSQEETLSTLVDEFGQQPMYYAFHEMLECFLEVEDYLKCAKIQKFIEIFSLNKLEVPK